MRCRGYGGQSAQLPLSALVAERTSRLLGTVYAEAVVADGNDMGFLETKLGSRTCVAASRRARYCADQVTNFHRASSSCISLGFVVYTSRRRHWSSCSPRGHGEETDIEQAQQQRATAIEEQA